MELALGLCPTESIAFAFLWFQSLFSWNLPSDSELGRLLLRRETGFQSLFSWNLPSDDDPKTGDTFLSLFQSLFSWNLPSDIAIQCCSAGRSTVSILVFVELALGRSAPSIRSIGTRRFNPCFRGTCPRTSNGDKVVSLKYCFNPCFRGTCPRTRQGRAANPPGGVSILVFVELALGRYSRTTCCTTNG